MGNIEYGPPRIYSILTFTFVGQGTAGKIAQEIRQSEVLEGQLIVAEVVVEKDATGKVHSHQPRHGTAGAVVGGMGGGLLALVGGPVGLLAWTAAGAVVGGIAGKYAARPFSKGDLQDISDALALDTSALLLLVDDIASEDVIQRMQPYNADVIKLVVGEDVSDEISAHLATALSGTAEPSRENPASDDIPPSDA